MSPTGWIVLVIVFCALGALIGGLVVHVLHLKQRTALQVQLAELRKQAEADKDKLQWSSEAEKQLRDAFDALASRVLRANSESFLTQTREQLNTVLKQLRGDWSTQKEQLSGVIQPVEKSLKQLDEQVRELEKRREGAYKGLEQHLSELRTASRELQKETGQLKTALTTSSRARGRWGELQLRRIVEMTGMLDHVDFEEQASAGDQRPDMIIRLPNDGVLPVDAKTSMEHYFKLLEAENDEGRARHARAHAAAMLQHIKTLGNKAYWKQFEKTPDAVVMFVPNEACMGAAFQEEPSMLEFGLEQQVMVATPVTLYGLLKSVAYGWQQQAITENARQIANEGRQLCDRLAVFMDRFSRAGRGLDTAVRAYNEAVGSVETRLLPSARRLKDLGATTKDAPEGSRVEQQVRVPAEVASPNEESEGPAVSASGS